MDVNDTLENEAPPNKKRKLNPEQNNSQEKKTDNKSNITIERDSTTNQNYNYIQKNENKKYDNEEESNNNLNNNNNNKEEIENNNTKTNSIFQKHLQVNYNNNNNNNNNINNSNNDNDNQLNLKNQNSNIQNSINNNNNKENSSKLNIIPDLAAFHILSYLWNPIDLQNLSQTSMNFREASSLNNSILWKQSALRPALNGSSTKEARDIYNILSCDYRNSCSNDLIQSERLRYKTEELLENSRHLFHRHQSQSRLIELCNDLKKQSPENEENITQYQSQMMKLLSNMELLNSEDFQSEITVIIDFRALFHPLEPPPLPDDEDPDIYCENNDSPKPIEIFARYTRFGNGEESLVMLRDYLNLVNLTEGELNTYARSLSNVSDSLNIDIPMDLFATFLVLAMVPLNNAAFHMLRSRMELGASQIQDIKRRDYDQIRAQNEGIDITESDNEEEEEGEDIDYYYSNDEEQRDFVVDHDLNDFVVDNDQDAPVYQDNMEDFIEDDDDDNDDHVEGYDYPSELNNDSKRRRIVDLDSEDSSEKEDHYDNSIDDQEEEGEDNMEQDNIQDMNIEEGKDDEDNQSE